MKPGGETAIVIERGANAEILLFDLP